MDERTTGAQWFKSSLGRGHIAGHGCVEDDYSERSGGRNYEKRSLVRFPNDNVDPNLLNGPVIIIKKGKTHE
jgi:hypothetical protein